MDRKYKKSLDEMNIRIDIAWVPGHAGLIYNEIADQAAKDGCKLVVKSIGRFEGIGESVALRWMKERGQERWNEMWRRSESGSWTRKFINKVGKVLLFPRDRSSGMAYVRALINNASVNDNIFRMGLCEGRGCECMETVETVEHVLMECKLEVENRKVLIDGIGEIWMECKMEGGLQFSLDLLLAPECNDRISVTVAEQICNKVFRFFRNLKKKL